MLLILILEQALWLRLHLHGFIRSTNQTVDKKPIAVRYLAFIQVIYL